MSKKAQNGNKNLLFRCPADLAAALDEWRNGQEIVPSINAALIALLWRAIRAQQSAPAQQSGGEEGP